MVLLRITHSDLDYNFSWFENAKEQKCMCGAENCRGFIGKRKALPPPPKPRTASSPKKGRGPGRPKGKRVVEGRITKISQTKVKAQRKNSKFLQATIVTARTKVKTTKATKVQTKVKKVKTAAVSKKSTTTTTLGKRKRTDSTVKARKSSSTSPNTGTIIGRKIAKPRSTRTVAVASHKKSSIQPLYESVSYRKKNVH